jgi:hypothetical protein
MCIGCESISNSVSGFYQANSAILLLVYSLSALNTGSASHGVANAGNYPTLIADTIAGNGGNGINLVGSGDGGMEVIATILEGNGGYAFNNIAASQYGFQVNNTQWYNNGNGTQAKPYNSNTCTSSLTTNFNCWVQIPTTQQSSTAFVGSGNYSLNTNASGGLLMRGTGYPTQFKDGINKTYLDLGAVQHQPEFGYLAQKSNSFPAGVFGSLALIIGFVGTRRLCQ